jgi:acyl transferase domain-containing protein
VLAGPLGPLAAVAAKLAAAELTCRTVPSLSAFHSPLVAESVAGATPVIAATPRRPPEVPVYSGYTAAPLGPAEVADPGFWARHPTDPVWFWQALDALLADGEFVLVEAGPGRGLSSIARRHPAVRRGRSTVVPLLPGKPGTADADRESLAAAMAALRAEGHVLTGIPLSV